MRTTRTNSGRDSKSVVRFGKWELEGETYLLVVGGAVCSVMFFLLCFSLALLPRICAASLPLVASLLWIRCFIAGRPPHYTGDFFAGLIAGKDFNLEPWTWAARSHPGKRRVEALGRAGA